MPASKPIIHPLLQPLEKLAGVGARTATLLQKLGCRRIADLALHLPTSYLDRRQISTVATAAVNTICTLRLTVMRHELPKGRSKTWRIFAADETGVLQLAFFNMRGDYLAKQWPVGTQIAVSGKVELYQLEKQITHPDYILPASRMNELAVLEPVYPLTAGISNRQLRAIISKALPATAEISEWLLPETVQQHEWPSFSVAMQQLHLPPAPPAATARTRLAYDELLANQLTLALLRSRARMRRGKPRKTASKLRAAVLSNLPFKLTPAQTKALAEIDADMAAPTRMVRLLQGDVGSGKTIVALLMLLTAIEAGEQAVLMAPTEILAAQHHATITEYLAGTGVRVALYTGSASAKARTALLGGLASGTIDLVIGTHALFQKAVSFANLGAAVIDEQHRFGVRERVALTNKGAGVDLLVMTATPIPRSLALTYYGDMEVSQLAGKPPGRQPIATAAIDLARLDEICQRLQKKLDAGEQAYWVCPLIEESVLIDIAAATERAALLQKILRAKIGLLHGQLPAEEKTRVMQEFAAGKIQLLVATTVIEVGVNVPNATVMVIDHAERFGLAQLHQLRGRVGRGTKASSCLLLYQSPLGKTARARLKLMRETEDGFVLAEEDLRLRGSGDAIGTRQSGTPDFKIADLALHQNLLLQARDEAKYILAKDENLAGARGAALRLLLNIFDMQTAISYLRGG